MSHYILDIRTASAHFPGIGRYVRNLTSALIPLLAVEEQLTLLGNAASWGAGETSQSGAKIAVGRRLSNRTIPVSVSPFDIGQQWRIPLLLRQLRAGGPSLYHSPYYLMPYRTGLPTVLTFYDVTPLMYPQSVSMKARLFFRLATTLALRAASRVIAISEAARDDLIRYFPVHSPKVRVVPLAADPRFQPQPASEVEAVREKYSLPTRFVLYFGTNRPHKNLAALIDAYAQLADRHAQPLVIAGAWDARYPQPKQRVEQYQLGDSVRFLGGVDDSDLPALYNAATLFVFPSLYEGFGLPVLEAMACGTPVACANTASLPEIVGEAGRLFDPHSAAKIKDAVAELLEDDTLRAELGERGLARAQRFSWQATAAATLHCYRELLGARNEK